MVKTEPFPLIDEQKAQVVGVGEHSVEPDDLLATRRRAQATIDRLTPTPEEIAEQSERRRRNYVDKIMARSTPAPIPEKKAMNEFFVQQDRERTLAFIRAKADRGERLSRQERAHLWSESLRTLDGEIAPLLKAGKVRKAIDLVAARIATNFIGAAERADTLEDRIALLESKRRRR
jgi:hypothetical protein